MPHLSSTPNRQKLREGRSAPAALALALALGATLLPIPAAAQDAVEAGSRRVLLAVRLGPDERLEIDGALEEPVWRRVAPAEGFLQREPATGAPATEPTEVRIVHDARRLVIGVTLHDSDPFAILQNEMRRDGSFDADDSFAWIIDSFLDGRTGYFFEINPAGAMGDGLVTLSAPGGGPGGGEGAEVNRSWDGIWTARVQRSETGWTAEIEIPLRTLSFNPALTTWGINFRRTVRRRNEQSLWTGHALNQGLTRIVSAGRLEGLRELSQGVGLDLKPYLVGELSSAPASGRPSAAGDADVGLDAFYNLTPALQLNLSVNTDFAETEVDDRLLNLTRFPLFLEEKRDFFLEGSSYFDFGRIPGRAVTPFFSRRIGRDDRGQAQRIDIGSKLTGRTGAFDVGVLHVRTGSRRGDDQIGEDVSVVRVRQRMLEQSYVGVLYTRRATRIPGDTDRHTVGVDAAFNTSRFRGDRNLDASAFYLRTSRPLDAEGSASFGGTLRYPNDPWTASISAVELQSGYDPAIGFVPRRGIRQYQPELEWSPRLDHPWIRSVDFGFAGVIQTDMRNRVLTRELELTAIQVNTHGGGRYQFKVLPHYERLDEDFEIFDGVVLPGGAEYRSTRYQIEMQTPEHRTIAVAPNVIWGDFLSGRRREVRLRVDVRPRRGFAFAAEAERNLVELAEGRFTADVYRFDANTQFSPWLSLANRLQYDTVSRMLGWQLRFHWIQKPGNDLYIVYTHNWQEILDVASRRFETMENRAATKLVYTVRL